MERDLFISEEETRRLADGKKYGPAQCRALKRKKIPYIIGAGNKPLVARAFVERKLVGKVTTPEPSTQPDFSVFPPV